MATRFGLASTVQAGGAAERSTAGPEKTPDPFSFGEEAWLSPHTAPVGRAQLFRACSASKEDCQPFASTLLRFPLDLLARSCARDRAVQRAAFPGGLFVLWPSGARSCLTCRHPWRVSRQPRTRSP